MTATKKSSYMLVAGCGAAVVWLDLGPALLAGLISFMILNVVHRVLFAWQLARSLRADAADRESGRVMPMSRRLATTATRVLAVALFLVLAALLAWYFFLFVDLAVIRLPVILGAAIPKLDKLVESYGLDLPFESIDELRALLALNLKANAAEVTHFSSLLTRRFAQIFVTVFVAVGAFWSSRPHEEPPSLHASLVAEMRARLSVFLEGFERIFGAQIAISFINMWVTLVFLRAFDFPYVRFLSLSTFVFGLLPVVGNVISNTLIVGTALSISPRLAALSLGFLVIAHKIEYFINSRIVESSTETPMWQVLLGILVGEAILGIPGVVLAPAIIHYVREELRRLPPPRA